MRFFLDEDLSDRVARIARNLGLDAHSVHEVNRRNLDDFEHLDYAAEHNKSVTRFLSNSGLTASSEASAKLLRDITLPHATLGGADLPNADLSGADLHGANLSNADLSEANLSADFLREANLSGADLLRANLSLAYLERANLSGANLHRPNLRGATALTDDKIAAAEFLGGATMPNGQKYEDWLKSESRE
jgi:uncharacterized protein YjbI with pentapeptide repeats